ncbi:hypothetical protein [Phytohalomonas tamaricis]|uniref:hypothetical protein n=1 Tax=Phytohalomonas tamaricis TaxID=2081032 RepID=UPI000D0B812E|nr:hypothetical protein [Phytohalomonas tamaricis]
MLLVITVVFALACFGYAFFLAAKIVSLLNTTGQEQFIVKTSWKAAIVMLCGVVPLAYVLLSH